MLPPDLEQRRVAILAEIEAAFRSASRRGGVSWNETGAIDDYGSEQYRAAARAVDKDTHWTEVAADPNWNPEEQHWGGFSFLDQVGFRYYLPAYIVRALRTRLSYDLFLTIEYGWGQPDWPPEQNNFGLFDARQLRAVAAFVRFAVAIEPSDPDFRTAGMPCARLYESTWRKFDL
jgi:hypothetical protein